MTDTAAPPVIWRPQPGSQEAFLACRNEREVLFGGARGACGKSDALIADYLQDVGKGFGPFWRGTLFRRTFPELDEVVARCQRIIPAIFPGARFLASKSDYEWRFPEGETLRLRAMRHENDYQNVKGHESPWQGWEELDNWPDLRLFLLAQASCRSSKPGVPKRIRANANPGGLCHDAIVERYRLPLKPGHMLGPLITDSIGVDGKPEPPRRYIHGDLSENKILLEADPGYIDTLRAACDTEMQWRAWRYGDWTVSAGGRFGWLWDPSIHVVEPFQIPESWYIDRSYDDGSSSPFSVQWWAESDGSDIKLPDGSTRCTIPGDLFLINEWYGWNGRKNEGLELVPSAITRGIIEREHGWGLAGRVNHGPGDTVRRNDFAQPVNFHGVSVPGIRWLETEKAPGSRVRMWSILSERLKKACPDPKTGIREKPGLFVFDICEQWLRTVPSVRRCPKNPDDVDTNDEDHAADSTGYRMLSASRPRARGGRTTNR